MRGLRPDLAIMDAPLIYHLPKFLFFLVIQGILIAVGVVATGASATPRMHACMRLLQSSTGAQTRCIPHVQLHTCFRFLSAITVATPALATAIGWSTALLKAAECTELLQI